MSKLPVASPCVRPQQHRRIAYSGSPAIAKVSKVVNSAEQDGKQSQDNEWMQYLTMEDEPTLACVGPQTAPLPIPPSSPLPLLARNPSPPELLRIQLQMSMKRKASQDIPEASPSKSHKSALVVEDSFQEFPDSQIDISLIPASGPLYSPLPLTSSVAGRPPSIVNELAKSVGLSVAISQLKLDTSNIDSRPIKPLPRSKSEEIPVSIDSEGNPFLVYDNASEIPKRKSKPRNRKRQPAKGTPQWAMSADPTNPVRIARPPNAWILYRSEKLSQIKQDPAMAVKPQSELSKLASALWRQETPAVKHKYEALAAQRKEEHNAAHPGMLHIYKMDVSETDFLYISEYRYSPQKKKGAKPASIDHQRLSRSTPASFTTESASYFADEFTSLDNVEGPSSPDGQWATSRLSSSVRSVRDDTVACAASIPTPSYYTRAVQSLDWSGAEMPDSGFPNSPLGMSSPTARFMPPFSGSQYAPGSFLHSLAEGLDSGAPLTNPLPGVASRDFANPFTSQSAPLSLSAPTEASSMPFVAQESSNIPSVPIHKDLAPFDDIWTHFVTNPFSTSTGFEDFASPVFSFGEGEEATSWGMTERSLSSVSSWHGLNTPTDDTLHLPLTEQNLNFASYNQAFAQEYADLNPDQQKERMDWLLSLTNSTIATEETVTFTGPAFQESAFHETHTFHWES